VPLLESSSGVPLIAGEWGLKSVKRSLRPEAVRRQGTVLMLMAALPALSRFMQSIE